MLLLFRFHSRSSPSDSTDF